MLTKLRRLIEFELSLAELVGIGVFVAGPYLFVGLVWACTHGQAFRGFRGAELALSVLGSIGLWPALVLAHVCLP